MKTLIFLLSIVFAFNLYSQDYNVFKNEMVKDITISDDDTVAGTTAITYSWETNKTPPYYYDYDVELDSLGDASNIYIVLDESYNNSNFYPKDSVLWYVTTSDTIVNFNNLSYTSTLASYTYNFASDSTTTVQAQTTTHDPLQGGCRYPIQRIRAYGAASGAGADITKIRLAFIKPD